PMTSISMLTPPRRNRENRLRVWSTFTLALAHVADGARCRTYRSALAGQKGLTTRIYRTYSALQDRRVISLIPLYNRLTAGPPAKEALSALTCLPGRLPLSDLRLAATRAAGSAARAVRGAMSRGPEAKASQLGYPRNARSGRQSPASA